MKVTTTDLLRFIDSVMERLLRGNVSASLVNTFINNAVQSTLLWILTMDDD